ncbi:ficolin-2-like [Patiria miniata]|uniref:Fibrinogen C-terminal domain-containing protein n=1 Tax=Patiria miniata TaxID=46514 RepID=A0A914ACM6_PATMI|nr:ficolin-2-like [Patiria miniata]
MAIEMNTQHRLSVCFVLITFGTYISARAKICYIHQSALNGGVAKWVTPLDPCSCTETRPGGVNIYMEDQETPDGYLDQVIFTQDTDKLKAWFGCDGVEEPTPIEIPGEITDCQDVLQHGSLESGLYIIYPGGNQPSLTVYCDMDTDGGGWIVFQRRVNGSVDFYRDWQTYRNGFGNLSGDFWLGNENLRRLTGTGSWELRVDLLAWDGSQAYTKYRAFRVVGNMFQLEVAGKEPGGGGGDSLSHHNGSKFSTLDQDNDGYSGSCALDYQGGWWYHSACILSHLNGPYQDYEQAMTGDSRGIVWFTFQRNYNSMKETQMKIRKTL